MDPPLLQTIDFKINKTSNYNIWV